MGSVGLVAGCRGEGSRDLDGDPRFQFKQSVGSILQEREPTGRSREDVLLQGCPLKQPRVTRARLPCVWWGDRAPRGGGCGEAQARERGSFALFPSLCFWPGFGCRSRTRGAGTSAGALSPPSTCRHLPPPSSTCKMTKAWGSLSQDGQIRCRRSETKARFEVCLLSQSNLSDARRRHETKTPL